MFGKWGLYLVIAIALSEVTFASANDNTNHSNADKQFCSVVHPSYKKAGDELYIELNSTLLSILRNQTKNLEPLRTKVLAFLDEAKHCTTRNITYNFTTFMNVIDFTADNMKLIEDLKEQHQFKCFIDNKVALTKCVNTTSNSTKYATLMQKLTLDINEITCSRTVGNKKCITQVLNKNCKPILVDFVSGIFKVLEKECAKVVTNTSQPKTAGAGNANAFWTGFVVLFIELAKLST